VAAAYADASRRVFVEVVGAAMEAMGIEGAEDGVMEELTSAGSQMMTVNCYPACPQPDLTLGMPPHSDYGFLTLVLQDEVEGLQVMHDGEWLTVDPVPGSFVVNVGDHFEVLNYTTSATSNHTIPGWQHRTYGKPNPYLLVQSCTYVVHMELTYLGCQLISASQATIGMSERASIATCQDSVKPQYTKPIFFYKYSCTSWPNN
jgi:hypothetical protein